MKEEDKKKETGTGPVEGYRNPALYARDETYRDYGRQQAAELGGVCDGDHSSK